MVNSDRSEQRRNQSLSKPSISKKSNSVDDFKRSTTTE
jgi:hypothetical protein